MTAAEIRRDMRADYGDRSGYVCVGSKARIDGDDGPWNQEIFEYPAELRQAVDWLAAEVDADKCVYRPSSLLAQKQRVPPTVDSNVISFEVDSLPPHGRTFLRGIGAEFRASGRKGHYHIRLFLDRDLPHDELRHLARWVMAQCGITGRSESGGKWNPHDMLRPLGTLNTKKGVRKPVRIVRVGEEVSLDALISLLDAEHEPDRSTPAPLPNDAQKVDWAAVPAKVQSEYAKADIPGRDHSGALWSVLNLCAEYGLSPELALGIAIEGRDDGRFPTRHDDDHLRRQIANAYGNHTRAGTIGSRIPANGPNQVHGKEGAHSMGEVNHGNDDDTTDDGAPVDPELFVRGGSFIHDAEANVPALWGNDGAEVWWSPNEGLMITGLTGVGKSTLAGLLVRARMGYADEVAGYPVKPGKKKVLYLAMDRPRQISRALRRQLGNLTRRQIDLKLVVLKGPPPSSFESDYKLLLKLARAAGADTVVVDSLKDAVPSLSREDAAGAWNRNIQHCNQHDIEVIVLHHQRKGTTGPDAPKPKSIHDVYGSQLLTAGLGSVLLLWRDKGPLIELSQLKGPAGEGNSIKLHMDNDAGTFTPPISEADKLEFFSTPRTIRDFAAFLTDQSVDDVKSPDVEKARRIMTSLKDRLLLTKVPVPENATGRELRADWYRAT